MNRHSLSWMRSAPAGRGTSDTASTCPSFAAQKSAVQPLFLARIRAGAGIEELPQYRRMTLPGSARKRGVAFGIHDIRIGPIGEQCPDDFGFASPRGGHECRPTVEGRRPIGVIRATGTARLLLTARSQAGAIGVRGSRFPLDAGRPRTRVPALRPGARMRRPGGVRCGHRGPPSRGRLPRPPNAERRRRAPSSPRPSRRCCRPGLRHLPPLPPATEGRPS